MNPNPYRTALVAIACSAIVLAIVIGWASAVHLNDFDGNVMQAYDLNPSAEAGLWFARLFLGVGILSGAIWLTLSAVMHRAPADAEASVVAAAEAEA